MTLIKQPLFSPIRFHNPALEFDNETTFQNPDNRLSTAYDWENVNEVPYALPIPKEWPDGQPGIDLMINAVDETIGNRFYAKLYDSDDADYKDLNVDSWGDVGTWHAYRVWINGLSGAGIEDGSYTIKLFATDDDELLLESETLLIADWFFDCIPFEFWNFENDFGILWKVTSKTFTSRIMVPIRLFDPIPEFEKEQYIDDPGVLVTLRTIAQRVFNFDSHPLPVHITELIQVGFSCSELYLDRIQINSEEAPEAELYEGTNLKYLTGKATFVDFNDQYVREVVETEREDQSIEWASHDYDTAVITGKSIAVNVPSISGLQGVTSDSIAMSEGDIVIAKITLTDDAGDSDLPGLSFLDQLTLPLVWGINYITFRINENAAASVLTIFHLETGAKAVYTGVIDVFKIV